MLSLFRCYGGFIALLCWLVSALVQADETDIYFSQVTSANPNVLFILDNSHSMSCLSPATGETIASCLINSKSRMQVMQEAFSSVMTAAPSNLNIGLMRYGGHVEDYPNGVSFPVKPIDLDAKGKGDAHSILIASGVGLGADNLPDPIPGTPVRTFLGDVVNSWSPQGLTPIVDSLYEAALYYRGGNVDFGRLSPEYIRAAHPSTYTGGVVSCPSNTTVECVTDWNECIGRNVIPGSCKDKVLTNLCCNWISTGEGSGYCKNDQWSCSGTFNVCQYNTCDDFVGNPTYVSPMQYECQANYIVLMSDGKPEYPDYDGGDGTGLLPIAVRDNRVQTLMGKTCASNPSGYKSGTCGPELAKFLADTDQSPGLTGKQPISTFTVAFGLDDVNGTAYLESLANVSIGMYSAKDEAGLKYAFSDILKRIKVGVTPKQQYAGTPVLQDAPELFAEDEAARQALKTAKVTGGKC